MTLSISPLFQRMTCRIGPKFSWVRSDSAPISKIAGATKLPLVAALGSASLAISVASLVIASECASSEALASASITGPTSVARSRGSPMVSASIAPLIIASIPSATSSCRNRTRSAEQRWPALWKLDATTSRVTCSGSAELSTIIAFCPPVSAISGMIAPSRAASPRLIARAVSVDPVNATPAISGCAVNAAPTLPSPGTTWTISRGIPA